MSSLFSLYFCVYVSTPASLYLSHLTLHLFISPSLWCLCSCRSLCVFFSFSFLFSILTLSYFSSLLISLICSPSHGFFSHPSLLLQLWRTIRRATSRLFLPRTSGVITVISQTLCISNFSPVKRGWEFPFSLPHPKLLWEKYSGVATAMVMAVFVETPYISGTSYP